MHLLPHHGLLGRPSARQESGRLARPHVDSRWWGRTPPQESAGSLHLVLFNHIALGLDAVFLEHIPHLREHFVHPVRVEAGVYRTPQEAGNSSDLKA